MVEFLTRKQTASWVEDIIKEAKNQIILISPYLQLSEDLLTRLKNADKQNVDIKIIYRYDEELKPNQTQRLEDEIKRLQQLKNLSLARLKYLHAKCYYNEDCMVITSMNLYDYSEKNNWEMGILIQKEHDEEIFKKAKEEAEAISESAQKIKTRSSFVDKVDKFLKGAESLANSLVEEEPKGHCIGCGRDMIPYNKNHPICRDCWKRGIRRGRFCYRCGKEWPTTQKKSLCDTCYHTS
jgi:phosphatidylserine/phosphatidylglycerophosphate/cardiolipin synthase-like enzyme